MGKYFLIILIIFHSCNNLSVKKIQSSLTKDNNSTDICGTIIKVSDGDTVILLTDDNKQLKIRLEGIDCPEKKQDFGEKAKQFTSTLCYKKSVTVKYMGTDKYNRILGIVRTDSVNVNEELLKNGLAWHYKSFNHSWKYSLLEKEAQRNNLNIWSRNDSMPPWEFRKKK